MEITDSSHSRRNECISEPCDVGIERAEGAGKGLGCAYQLLFVGKVIVKEAKSREKHLAMTWIDYKKAFDMVPHSWCIECLYMLGIADNMKQLLMTSMKNWKTELTSFGDVFAELTMRRGIHLGDSVSLLLFVMPLIPLTSALNNSGKK